MSKILQTDGSLLTYRIAIVIPHRKKILAEVSPDHPVLPTISISRWDRVAEQITHNTKKRWNLQTIVVDSFPASHDVTGLAILEDLSSYEASHTKTLCLCDVDQIRTDDRTLNLLREMITGPTQNRGPLQKLQWIEEVKRWLQENMQDRNILFTHDVRQLNAGGGFVLIRLGVSNGPAYWVKAVGPPNIREAAITEALWKCSPSSLPPLVAVHNAWNAWAVEEVGSALTDCVDVPTISLVAARLALLQQQTIGHDEEFLRCGCGNQQIGTLRSYLPKFLGGLSGLGRIDLDLNQSGYDTTALISRIDHILNLALDGLERLGIPDTINNNDMKLANILFDGTQCFLIDWCHAHWGNPFLTFQHLHIYLLKRLPALAFPFQERYASFWENYLARVHIQQALTFSSIIAPYAYLCTSGTTSLFLRATDPYIRRLFSNVVRRILNTGEQLCPQEVDIYA